MVFARRTDGRRRAARIFPTGGQKIRPEACLDEMRSGILFVAINATPPARCRASKKGKSNVIRTPRIARGMPLALLAAAVLPCAVAATDLSSPYPLATSGLPAPAAASGRIVPPRLPSDAEDSPAEAQRFFLKKRLAPGMTHYPVDRLMQAQREAARLPLFS